MTIGLEKFNLLVRPIRKLIEHGTIATNVADERILRALVAIAALGM